MEIQGSYNLGNGSVVYAEVNTFSIINLQRNINIYHIFTWYVYVCVCVPCSGV